MRSRLNAAERMLSLVLTVLIMFSMVPSSIIVRAEENEALKVTLLEDKGGTTIPIAEGTEVSFTFFAAETEEKTGSVTAGENGVADLTEQLAEYRDSINNDDITTVLMLSIDEYDSVDSAGIALTAFNTTIEAKFKKNTFKLTFNKEGYGSIFVKSDPDDDYAEAGESMTVTNDKTYAFKFTASDAPAEGEEKFAQNRISQLKVNGADITLGDVETEKEVDGVTFADDAEISVTFEEKYSVTVSAAESSEGKFAFEINGQSDDPSVLVSPGDNAAVNITANENCLISKVMINNEVAKDAENNEITNVTEFSYSIEEADKNYDIQVYAVSVYSVTVEYNAENGSVTINDSEVITEDGAVSGTVEGIVEGDELTIVATPIDKTDSEEVVTPYTISKIVFNPAPDGDTDFDMDGNYIMPEDDLNHFSSENPFKKAFSVNNNISAQFYFVPFRYNTIGVVDGDGGTISPNKAVTVNHGETSTYTLTPNNNYSVSSIALNEIDILSQQPSSTDDETHKYTYEDIDGIDGTVYVTIDPEGCKYIVEHEGVTADEEVKATFRNNITSDKYYTITSGALINTLVREEDTDSHSLKVYNKRQSLGSSTTVTLKPGTNYEGIVINPKSHGRYWTSSIESSEKSVTITRDKKISGLMLATPAYLGGYNWNYVDISPPLVITFDTDKPTITLDGVSTDSEVRYYSGDEVDLGKLTVNDIFSGTDSDITAEERSSGLKYVGYRTVFKQTVTYKDTENDTDVTTDTETGIVDTDLYTYTSENISEGFVPVYSTGNTGNIKIDISDYEYSLVDVTVSAYDRASNPWNSTVKNVSFVVAKETPDVAVIANDDNTRDYYNTNRNYTVLIDEKRPETLDKNGLKVHFYDEHGNELTNNIPNYTVAWADDPDGHTGAATITFSDEGKYSWSLSYTNKAGVAGNITNAATVGDEYVEVTNDDALARLYNFVIDKTAPTGSLRLDDDTVWNHILGDILETITFGLWKKDPIEVVAEVTNEENSLSTVHISYYKQTLDMQEVQNANYVITPLAKSELNGKPFQDDTFSVEDNEAFVIYAKLADEAGNVSYIYTDGLVFDNVETSSRSGHITFRTDSDINGFQNNNFKVHITVDERSTDGEAYSGIKTVKYKITYYSDTNGQIGEETDTLIRNGTDNKLVPMVSDDIVVNAKEYECDSAVVEVTVTDNAGNEYSNSIEYSTNVMTPKVYVSFDGDNNSPISVKKDKDGEERGYFNKTRTATISIIDKNWVFNADNASAAITIDKATNSNGEDISDTNGLYTISEWETDDEAQNKHTATVTFNADANYTWHFDTYTNNAGNSNIGVDTGDSKTPFRFTIDTKDPKGWIQIGEWTETWDQLIEDGNLLFAMFSHETVGVVATADDATSTPTIYYYKTDKVTPMSKKELDDLKDTDWTKFSKSDIESEGISPDEKFVFYVKIVDDAGNYIYINSDGVIVEATDPTIELEPRKPNENGAYGSSFGGSIDVKVTVNDPGTYSGINKVEYWTVDAGVESEVTTLYTFEKDSPTYEELRSEYSGTIKIDLNEHNRSDTKLYVKVTDNAGNESQKNVNLDIDVTAPTISVRYNMYSKKPGSEDGYYSSRTATVTITERDNHFDPSKVDLGIVAKDSNGKELENWYEVDEWSTQINSDDPDLTTHTLKVHFNKDANFTFEPKVTDKAGNKSSASRTQFTVDNVAPTGSITIKNITWYYLFRNVSENLTFGIYAPSNVAVSAKLRDATSPFTAEYYLTDSKTALSEVNLNAVADEEWKPFDELKESGISADRVATVYLRLTDKAANRSYINSNGVIVENDPPKIELESQAPNDNGEYGSSYGGSVDVNLTVKDPEPYSGINKVEYWTVDAGVKSKVTTLYSFNIKDPFYSELKSAYSDTIQLDQSAHNSSDTKLYVKVTDNAGNESQKNVNLDIDVTAPNINVKFDDTANKNAANGYYTSRKATVTITERTNHFDPDKVQFDITAKNSGGNDINNSWSLGEWKTVESKDGDPDKAVHTATLTFVKDANYTFDISYTDDAGNANNSVDYGNSKTPNQFTVDTEAPTGSVTIKNGTWDYLFASVSKILTFGIFENANVGVSADVSDETSPFTAEYYLTDSKTALSEVDLNAVADEEWKPFDELKESGISANSVATVYLKLTDNAGNYRYINSDGVVVESKSPTIELKRQAPNENGAYGSSYGRSIDVKVAVKDPEPYSGINKVEYWTVDAGVESEVTTLYTFGKNSPTYEELRSEYSGTIKIDLNDHNSSDTKLYVKATDNSGNISQKYIDLDIDVTAPTIKVIYNDTENKNASDGYYTSRKATITITERTNHFDPDKVQFDITAKDLGGEDVNNSWELSEWKTIEVEGEAPDQTTHTATLTFVKDANYTFDISYTDDAGNEVDKQTGITYRGSNNHKFTVDTKAPEGSLTIDNKSWDYLFAEQLKKLTFGIFSNKTLGVTADVSDKTSPHTVYYYISDSTAALTKEELDNIGDANWILFDELSIDPDRVASVYMKLIDYAGNYRYINSDGNIVEDNSPLITLEPAEPNENNAYGKSYGGNVEVKVTVNDTGTYSGIKKVEYWTVDAGVKSKVTTLYSFNKKDPLYSELESEYSTTIYIDQTEHNSSDTKLYVQATDNADNTSYASVDLDIDVTPPKIIVKYDDVSNEGAKDGYFISRKATITVIERDNHFDEKSLRDNITITAKDLKGNEIDNSWSLSEWKTIEVKGEAPDQTEHTATLTFEKDANYTFDITYTDKAGNTVDKIAGITYYGSNAHKFTVDTKAPTGSVSINEHSWNYVVTELRRKLTFGLWSHEALKIRATADDLTSEPTIEYILMDDTRAYSQSELDGISEWTEYKEKDTGFDVPPDKKFTVYLKLTDLAGNYCYISSEGAVADNVAPSVIMSAEKPDGFVYGLDYEDGITVNATITDNGTYNADSGIRYISYWVERDGIMTVGETPYIYDNNNPSYDELEKTVNISFKVIPGYNNSSDIKIYIEAIDNAGNTNDPTNPKSTFEPLKLDIDMTRPEIKVEYEDTANAGAETGYFTSRKATVTVKERADHFDGQNVLDNIKITAKNAKGEPVKGDTYKFSEWKTTEGAVPDDALHTMTITYAADANYTFDISCTDKAGNSSTEVDVSGQTTPFEFTVDTTKPAGTLTAKSDEGRSGTWKTIADTLTFGFWSKSGIDVTSTATDVTSPIKENIEYYILSASNAEDNTTALTVEDLDAVKNWLTFDELRVARNRQFTVYMKITDFAGNYSYVSTNGLIVDDKHPLAETVAPEIRVSPEYPLNGIYDGSVKVSIEVVDPLTGGTYSGLKDISYSVFDRTSATPNVPTQSGTLYTFKQSNPRQSDLLRSWTGEITVDSSVNNSNEIQIVVYATDNAGNSGDSSQQGSEGYCMIKIDTTPPVIDISYDNNNADSNTYFNRDRIATIRVTERNFDPDDVEVKITNTDGPIPSISGWSVYEGSYNGDDTVYEAEIAYTEDGDYTFEIDCSDLAGNRLTTVSYASDTVAAEEFTIDKTLPTITVTYDNNSAQNGNYYKENREATITVIEHNFEPSRIKVSITATDDGNAAEIPALSGWGNNGDVHVAKILYDKDALYSFDITAADMAGNNAEDYTQEKFYIDKTAPVVEITGVADKSANKGQCIPVLKYRDTNIDNDKIGMTLFGANNKTVKPSGSFEDIHNGRVFTFADFKKEKKTDDIYTLTGSIVDKAGNSAEKKIRFSVNRFGSAYALSDDTEGINRKYVKEPIDVVVTEINADKLNNISITVFRNNETIVLEKGVDYEIKQTGGDGQWYEYVYTIFKSVFAEDGLYSVVFDSDDSAGNHAKNTLDTKNMELSFGIDKTTPTVNVKNVERGKTYAVDSMTVFVSANDNLDLSSIRILLDGTQIAEWKGDALRSIIMDGKDFTFDIDGKSTRAHTLKIVAEDSAGNTWEELVDNFYVTTNLAVRYINNKPLFFGSIFGALLLILGIIFLATRKRKDS